MKSPDTVRLVAVDLDRTLLDDNRQISRANLRALDRIAEDGVHIAVCSGRDVPATLAITGQMDVGCWYVVQNGSLVLNPSQDAVYVRSLSPEAGARALDALERHGLASVVYDIHPRSEHVWWQNGADAATGVLEFRRQHGSIIEFVDDMRAVIMRGVSHLEVFGPKESIFAVDADVKNDNDIVSIVNVSSSRPDFALMGLYPTGTAKELALDHVIGHLEISSANVLAIGDNLNDVGMVRWAGTGVMVANGPEEALAAADWIAPSNNDDGVAAAIDRFVP